MKTLILLSLILLSLAACKKDAEISPKVKPLTPATVFSVLPDTIPDKAALRIKLCKDSVNTDETLLAFNHTSSLSYKPGEDAPYFSGFGQVSLSSISGNGIALAINQLPYTSDMSIGLNVHTTTDGTYLLKISYMDKIPANTQVWLKDAYQKDSLDMRSGNYSFKVIKADTSSFGKNRFTLVLRGGSQAQTTLSH